jgi:hypothetical protein
MAAVYNDPRSGEKASMHKKKPEANLRFELKSVTSGKLSGLALLGGAATTFLGSGSGVVAGSFFLGAALLFAAFLAGLLFLAALFALGAALLLGGSFVSGARATMGIGAGNSEHGSDSGE